jgi:hypothetical protein
MGFIIIGNVVIDFNFLFFQLENMANIKNIENIENIEN